MTISLLSMSGAALGSAAIACLLVFGILFLVWWACGKFGIPPLAHKIIGAVCAIIMLVYVLSRTGLMPSVQL